MIERGVTVHEGYDWSAIPEGALIISVMKSFWLLFQKYGNQTKLQTIIGEWEVAL